MRKLFFLVSLALLIAGGICFAASVWTTDAYGNEQNDFAPEEPVYIHGSAFIPESIIEISVSGPDGSSNSGRSMSDDEGNFTYVYLLIKTVGNYTVNAYDDTNSASMIFTDAAIYTRLNGCGGSRDENQYGAGEEVWIEGDGLDSLRLYNWKIYGLGGSCDSGVIVASGQKWTNLWGDFCFNAYIIQENDCGEYRVHVEKLSGSGGKNDNYHVGCIDRDDDGYDSGPYAGCISGNDCDDSDPDSNPGENEICNNGIDDDCDGCIDCADSDCSGNPSCSTCGNGIVEGTEECDGGECCDADCTFASAGTPCDDGLFCNEGETCDGLGTCNGGSARDCTGNDIPGIGTCDYDPDNIHYTWDYRDPFTSMCDETDDKCTEGNKALNHQPPTIGTCDVQCLANSDCAYLNGVCADGICNMNTYTCEHHFKSSSTICRASEGVCDVEEYCTGSSDSCPSNDFLPPGTVCRESAGICDIADTCSGLDYDCPHDIKSTSQCRASAGVCDMEEYCDGLNNDCPMDEFMPYGFVCEYDPGQCEADDTCNGFSAICNEKYAPYGISCDDGLFCNVDEICDGAGTCSQGTPRDCTGNNLPTIDECGYAPDSNPFTIDYAEGFTSACDEGMDECTSGSYSFTHTCSVLRCGAECDSSSQKRCLSPGTSIVTVLNGECYAVPEFDTCYDNCTWSNCAKIKLPAGDPRCIINVQKPSCGGTTGIRCPYITPWTTTTIPRTTITRFTFPSFQMPTFRLW